MKKLVYLSFVLWFYACSNGGGAVETVDMAAYTLSPVPGTDWQRALKFDGEGNLLEEGYFRNGLKTGTWALYEGGNEFPTKIITYIDGQYNGLYLELNDRGQINLRTAYKNNKLNGFWGKYRFGRPEEEAEYKDGKLDGMHKVYYVRTGKLQSSTEFKNGVQDGWYRFYNEEGEVTLEYEYKNGEKISGGIVNPDAPNEPK